MAAEIMAPMGHPDYKSEIAEIIRSSLAPKLKKERILSYHENDIAAALSLLTREERSKFYNILDIDSLSEILEYADELYDYLEEMNMKKRIEILSRLETPTVVEYLKGIEKKERSSIIALMADDARSEISLLASFDEDEIGSKMTTNYIRISSGISVRQAMRELVDQAAENDNISTLYVVDSDGVYYGAIDLKDLIIARDGTALEEITRTSYPYVYASELIEDCIERIKSYSEDSIPVLGEDNTQMSDDEISEDYAKLAGLTAEEDLHEPLGKSIRKRLPWLVILLGLGLVVSSVVGLFESVVAGLTLIICFQSLVLDMAGNVGTQSLAVTIRVLMDDDQLTAGQKLLLVGKEARVGLCNGAILGVLSVSFWRGAALLIAMILSSLSGTVVPILFKKMKIDPAVASGPLITTINDLVAVVTYYGLAWLLLIQALHL